LDNPIFHLAFLKRRNTINRFHKPFSNSIIRHAFSNASVSPRLVGSKLVQDCVNALHNKHKETEDEKRGWSATLSFRTYQELKAQEIVQ